MTNRKPILGKVDPDLIDYEVNSGGPAWIAIALLFAAVALILLRALR